jgi:hypothetical protein
MAKVGNNFVFHPRSSNGVPSHIQGGLKLPQPKQPVPQSKKTQATRQAMYVQLSTLAHSDLHMLDFCQVIPFNPHGVTLSVGVHKSTSLSRNVTAVFWVLY